MCSSSILILVVVFALLFDIINGFHDTANSIATTVSTKVLSPRHAVLMSAVFNFIGALTSNKVAHTISNGLIDSRASSQTIVLATLLAAIVWNLVTWYFGIPSSSSHALIGGLLGASITFVGSIDIIKWGDVLKKVLIPLISAPVLGFVFGYILMSFLYEVLRPFSQATVNKYSSKIQILTAVFMSYSHGSNDAQKSMGIITLALITAGYISPNDGIPLWVVLSCALAMALGTSIGGWKIIKTVGVNIIKLQPISGCAANTGAAMVIEAMSFVGAPVSTTHVISSTIMGVGASKRLSSIRWALAKNIVWAWVLTIPISALIGSVFALILKFTT